MMNYCCTIDVVTRLLPQEEVSLPIVRGRLIELARDDQRERQTVIIPSPASTEADWLGADWKRADEVVDLLRMYGAFNVDHVGVEGCRALWLIAKHAGAYRSLATDVLNSMQKDFAVDPTRTFAAGIPYLLDSVLLNDQDWADGAVQIFGTVFGMDVYHEDYVERRKYELYDSSRAAEWRENYGLATLDACRHMEMIAVT